MKAQHARAAAQRNWQNQVNRDTQAMIIEALGLIAESVSEGKLAAWVPISQFADVGAIVNHFAKDGYAVEVSPFPQRHLTIRW